MLEEAKILLEQKYKESLERVKGNEYFENYANEKMVHSLQVFGLGKHIYKHEFRGYSEKFKQIALTAVLLHDIGRFEEISRLYESNGKNKSDHGVLGYEFLKKTQFNDMRIIFPIKHHGHMIEEFYADSEYKNIEDENLKKEIEQIIFLVRDADKMANLYLFVDSDLVEKSMIYKLNIINKTEEMKKMPISEGAWKEFIEGKVINNWNIISAADEIFRLLGWLYDVNYKTSFKYFEHHKLLNKYIKYLRYYSQDEKKLLDIETKVEDYVLNRITN